MSKTSGQFLITELLRLHADQGVIERIRLAVGSDADFSSLYLPVIERFVERVMDLPLRPSAFEHKGGTIQCALRSALLAIASSQKVIFCPNATAAERMHLEKQYRWLACCATLATVYLITSAHVRVISEDGEEFSWCDDEPLSSIGQQYIATWVDRPVVALPKLFPHLFSFFFPGQFAHLSSTLIAELGQAINPTLQGNGAEPVLARVVRQSIEKTLTDERSRCMQQISAPAPAKVHIDQVCPSELTADKGLDADASKAATSPAASESAALGHASAKVAAADLHGREGHGIDESADLGDTQQGQRPDDQKAQQARPQNPLVAKASEWLAALPTKYPLGSEVTLDAKGQIHITRVAMNFGARPSDTYQMLHGAGFVAQRGEKSVVLTREASAIYQGSCARTDQARARANS